MSLDLGVTTSNRGRGAAPNTVDFGPGFSTIDINTVIRNSRTIIPSDAASQTTTFATFTRRPQNRIETSLDDIQSTSIRLLPTNRPPLVTSPPSIPNFPSLIIGTDVQKTGSVTATSEPVPNASMDSTSNESATPSAQPVASSSPRITTGGAVGIAIVVVAVLVLFGFGVFRYMKQRKLQGAPPSSDLKNGKTPQMANLPYMANERSLEEGWESGSTMIHYPFEDPDRLGLGLSGIGDSEQRNSSSSRLPITR